MFSVESGHGLHKRPGERDVRKGRGVAWTEERGTSDEGRRRLKGAPQESGYGAMTDAADAAAGAPGTADHRREQMLRAALEVIAERGYADTRIADVAERTGISPALVIYYFKTKDQLLTEAIRYSEDAWYADGQRRLAALPTAAARVEEIVAMSCLPEADPEPHDSWLLWLDFWALAARNPEVAGLRQKADE